MSTNSLLYCVIGRPPAEADIQRFFGVTPPTTSSSPSNAPA